MAVCELGSRVSAETEGQDRRDRLLGGDLEQLLGDLAAALGIEQR
jgi:hypothetical protein